MGDFSEVAHILPKSKFKSIATLDKNIIYLCGWKSENNCHGKYDNCSNKDLRNMIIFPKILKSFDELCDLIEEKITYKDYDRWQV